MPMRRRGTQARRRLLARRAGDAAAMQPRGDPQPDDPFAAMVERALATIPPPFSERLHEVAIVIEDRASPATRRAQGLRPGQELYGLYEGVPRTEWGADWLPYANKITIYREPLERDFRSPAALAEQVRRTVVHELAHHLGISDERLDRLGVD